MKLGVGTLVSRVEAPTVTYRVSERFPTHVRVLPFKRSGREAILMSMKLAGRTRWIGDGSEWTIVGHS